MVIAIVIAIVHTLTFCFFKWLHLLNGCSLNTESTVQLLSIALSMYMWLRYVENKFCFTKVWICVKFINRGYFVMPFSVDLFKMLWKRIATDNSSNMYQVWKIKVLATIILLILSILCTFFQRTLNDLRDIIYATWKAILLVYAVTSSHLPYTCN